MTERKGRDFLFYDGLDRGIHNTKHVLQCVQIGQKSQYSYQGIWRDPVYMMGLC